MNPENQPATAPIDASPDAPPAPRPLPKNPTFAHQVNVALEAYGMQVEPEIADASEEAARRDRALTWWAESGNAVRYREFIDDPATLGADRLPNALDFLPIATHETDAPESELDTSNGATA